MTDRKNWNEVRAERLQRSATRNAYNDARRAYQLGQEVRALREAMGLSQRELAERMGTTQSVIARLEGGGSRPSLTTLERIAEALGMTIEVHFKEPEAAAS
jgi:ribosome-binding protein aMBF1 (putative translation factor)